jgi:hypothetical protein
METCAKEAPEAARTAKAIKVFFIRNTPRLNIELRTDCSEPRANLLVQEVEAIAPDRFGFGKEKR